MYGQAMIRLKKAFGTTSRRRIQKNESANTQHTTSKNGGTETASEGTRNEERGSGRPVTPTPSMSSTASSRAGSVHSGKPGSCSPAGLDLTPGLVSASSSSSSSSVAPSTTASTATYELDTPSIGSSPSPSTKHRAPLLRSFPHLEIPELEQQVETDHPTDHEPTKDIASSGAGSASPTSTQVSPPPAMERQSQAQAQSQTHQRPPLHLERHLTVDIPSATLSSSSNAKTRIDLHSRAKAMNAAIACNLPMIQTARTVADVLPSRLASPFSSTSLSAVAFAHGIRANVRRTTDRSIAALDVDPQRKRLLGLLESSRYRDNAEGMRQLIQMVHADMLHAYGQRVSCQQPSHSPSSRRDVYVSDVSLSSQLVMGGMHIGDSPGQGDSYDEGPTNSSSTPPTVTVAEQNGVAQDSSSSKSTAHCSSENSLHASPTSLCSESSMSGEMSDSDTLVLGTDDRDDNGGIVLGTSDNDIFAHRLQLAVLTFFQQAVPLDINVAICCSPARESVDDDAERGSDQQSRPSLSVISFDSRNVFRAGEGKEDTALSDSFDDGDSTFVCEELPHEHPVTSGKHEGRLQLAAMRALSSALQCHLSTIEPQRVSFKQHRNWSSPTKMILLLQQSAFWTDMMAWFAAVLENVDDVESPSMLTTSLTTAAFVCQCLRLLATIDERSRRTASYGDTREVQTSVPSGTLTQWMRHTLLPFVANARAVGDARERGRPNNSMLKKEAGRLLRKITATKLPSSS